MPCTIHIIHSALYGALFKGKEEAGFSNYRMWESLGFLFAFVLQTQVRAHEALLWGIRTD